ncbi:MAG: hypothetical protein R2755_28120 [Acidimicrobiales bacterium]
MKSAADAAQIEVDTVEAGWRWPRTVRPWSPGSSPESAVQKMVRFGGGAAAIIATVLVLLGIIAIEAVNRPRRSQRVQPPAMRSQPPAASNPVNSFPPLNNLQWVQRRRRTRCAPGRPGPPAGGGH